MLKKLNQIANMVQDAIKTHHDGLAKKHAAAADATDEEGSASEESLESPEYEKMEESEAEGQPQARKPKYGSGTGAPMKKHKGGY